MTSTGTCTYTTFVIWRPIGLLLSNLTSSYSFSYQYFARFFLAIIPVSLSADSETRIQRNLPKCGNHHLSLAWGIWLPCISRLVVSNLPPVHFPCQVVVDVNHRAICPKLAFQWREQPTEIFYSIRVNLSAAGQCNWTKYLGARWKSLIWKIEWEIENWLGSMNKKKFKRDIEVLRAGGRAGDEKCPALMSCDMSTVTLASNCDLRWQNDCAHALTNTRIQMHTLR